MRSVKALFVDDEQLLLDALERSLLDLDGVDITLTTKPDEARAILKQGDVDLFVTDMRMPIISGHKLIEEARVLSPATIRVMLSGQAEPASVAQSIGITHRYLSKPCNTNEVLALFILVSAMREFEFPSDIVKGLNSLAQLPCLRSSREKLQSISLDSRDDLEKLIAVFEGDLGLAAKILQIANGGFFRTNENYLDVATAIKRLGPTFLTELIKNDYIFSTPLDDPKLNGFLEMLTKHSIVVSKSLHALERSDSSMLNRTHEATTLGLLHDLGQIILAMLFPSRYLKVLEQWNKNRSVGITKIEESEFGVSHPAVGKYILTLWGLPAEICRAIGEHHDEISSQDDPDRDKILHALYVAELLEDQLFDELYRENGRAEKVT